MQNELKDYLQEILAGRGIPFTNIQHFQKSSKWTDLDAVIKQPVKEGLMIFSKFQISHIIPSAKFAVLRFVNSIGGDIFQFNAAGDGTAQNEYCGYVLYDSLQILAGGEVGIDTSWDFHVLESGFKIHTK